MDKFWHKIILNNSISDWAIALGIIAISFIVLRLLQLTIVKKAKLYVAKTKTKIDDFAVEVFQSSAMPLLYILFFYIGLRYITLPIKIQNTLHVAILLVATFFILKIINSFVRYLFNNLLLSREMSAQRKYQARMILLVLQVIIWFLGFLFILDNLGYNMTTFMAGLGIGGIAIALAAQTILGDLFSYLVIFFDKPFEIGDFIIVDDKLGTVEYIGIKTTRIRTLGGEQLICSNTYLTNSRVHNHKRMHERRAAFNFGVMYGTPAAKLEIIPPMIKQIIEGTKMARFDRAHFRAFGSSSLDFEVVYYVLSPDYNLYMDIQQSINLKICNLFEQEKIKFALPIQKVYLNNGL